MSKDVSITKRADLPEKARTQLIEAGLDLNVGDIFLRDDRGYHRYAQLMKITKIRCNKKTGAIEYIAYGENEDWEGTEFSESYGGGSLDDFKRTVESEGWVKLSPEQIMEYRKMALDVIEGRISIDAFKDKKSDVINTETALIGRDTKMGLIAIQNELEVKRNHALTVARFVGREMEMRKQELDKIKEKMYGVVAEFKNKIKKIMRVITTIELYLGIDEEIFCIQEGEKAPADTPITFRQALLYVDEEIGHWENGGLDWTNIEWFDNWLITNDNYKKCFPEKKGLVVFRPRRHEKDYQTGDARYEAQMNDENKMRTYILVRNGDCLYRIYTEKIVILPRLFPKRTEMEELMREIQKLMSKGERLGYSDERDKDELENLQYQYRKRAVLMQGLIDRTEIFHPLPAEKVNIFNLDELGDKVQFIYDDEAALTDGRLSFWDWHKKLNSEIKHGSRIMITGYYRDTDRHYGARRSWVSDRIFFYTNEYNTPPPPRPGVYDVVEYKEETRAWLDEEEYEACKDEVKELLETRQDKQLRHWKSDDPLTKPHNKNVKNTDDYIKEYHVVYFKKHLTILHNPGDEVVGGWGREYDPHERKKRIRFAIKPDDSFLLNYDNLELSDIEFYINSRIDRPNYLKMMPVLIRVKEFLLEEQKGEADFKTLLYQQSYNSVHSYLSEEELIGRVNRCIDWWKYKNQIKRAITKDDTLALRMIVKRICSPNYRNLKWD